MATNNNLGIFATNDDAFVNDETLTLDRYLASNPLTIQSNILKIFENRSGGKRYIADPNNSFMFILELLSDMVSGNYADINTMFNRIYGSRATNDDELHQHISDFEYVGLYSTPAQAEIEYIIDADHLINNSILTEDGYRLARIPEDTQFTIGNIPFGIHHPIDIKINPATSSMVVSYNGEKKNPLNNITTSILTKRTYKKDLMNLLSITIPIYQFDRTVSEDTLTKDLGFTKTYTFNNKFYAARIFHYKDNEWVEMNTTLSNFNYDVDAVTAKIKVTQDLNQLTVDVPYIYFNRGVIGTKIRVIIYTTLGELEVDVSDISDNSIGIKYNNIANDVYVNVLKSTSLLLMRSTSNKIFGGSNGMDFTSAKNTVLYNSEELVPITENDVYNYFNKFGLNQLPMVDDINDRKYIAAKYLVLNDDTPVEVMSGPVVIDMELASQLDSVKFNNDMVTLLPTTLYKVFPGGEKIFLASQEEIDILDSKSGEELATYINDTSATYFTYPYHLVIDKQQRYPKAVTYDVFGSTSIKYLMYHSEHQGIALSIDVLVASIAADKNGKEYIDIKIGISKDDIIENNQLTCVLTANAINSEQLGWVGEYEAYLPESDIHVYRFRITTDFMFNGDSIHVTNPLKYTSSEPTNPFINLKSVWKVTLFVDSVLVPDVVPDSSLQSYLPYVISNNEITGVRAFEMEVTLGDSIEEYIDNTLTVTWDGYEYETHEVDVPLTYDLDVVARDANGIPIYEIIEDEVIFNFLHRKGDIVTDEFGNIIYKYKAGDIKLDTLGNPIPLPITKMNYTVQMFLVNYIYAISSRKVKKSYLYQIRNELLTVFTNMKEIYKNILDNTTIGFRPISTLGSTTSTIGDITTVMDLRLSFNFTYYVSGVILENSETMAAIRNTTISVIDNYLANNTIIAMSAIIKQLHNSLEGDVYSIVIDGFNDSNIKTIVNDDTSKRFVIRTDLVYEELNDMYYHEKAVNISFVEMNKTEI